MARFGHCAGMPASRRFGSLRSFALGFTCIFILQQAAHAQFGGGGGNTIGAGATAGVAVDADGVLKRTMANDPTGALARQRAQEAIMKLDRNVAQKSPLRKVSLTRLERVLKERLADGKDIDDT